MVSDPGDRYRLNELLTLYEYEPTLRDLYVEGTSDAGFFRWYLMEHQLLAHVYAIDDRVEVPADVVQSVGQDVNARGRAVALAIYCERSLGRGQTAVTVVVDADFVHVVGPVPLEASCLLLTDDGALECYALSGRPLAKALNVCFHTTVEAETVLSAIGPALGDIFAVRILFKSLDLGLADDIAAVCELSEFASSADLRELIRRSLTGVAKEQWPAELDDLEQMANEYRVMVTASGQKGRGHDIAPLIRTYLEIRGHLAQPRTLEMALLSSLVAGDLDDQPLFARLRERLSAA